VTSHQIAVWEGRAFYGLAQTLQALDLATGWSERVAMLPGKIDNIAVSPRGHLYVSCGADLYRIPS
jgi:hypothetical protein